VLLIVEENALNARPTTISSKAYATLMPRDVLFKKISRIAKDANKDINLGQEYAPLKLLNSTGIQLIWISGVVILHKKLKLLNRYSHKARLTNTI